ncbi:hypothetical protein H257_15833 [Aphanomyces astaci]|uniref:Uncharacterized protein n=1 Tax=Aphanomyces astaci TaxID=112090 RepID=W4FN42_APHAT|nr:hypothetical protein H257_15833 [Aphanomyces astaci]ETV68073.1 hypothetical protein H257_15833 [Aphanomyces astaci]|eukprot:XP_009842372.1 hypothetical protein H257_15833 [Aphanomyces astaci]
MRRLDRPDVPNDVGVIQGFGDAQLRYDLLEPALDAGHGCVLDLDVVAEDGLADFDHLRFVEHLDGHAFTRRVIEGRVHRGCCAVANHPLKCELTDVTLHRQHTRSMIVSSLPS